MGYIAAPHIPSTNTKTTPEKMLGGVVTKSEATDSFSND
jgi:hypothetical protein